MIDFKQLFEVLGEASRPDLIAINQYIGSLGDNLKDRYEGRLFTSLDECTIPFFVDDSKERPVKEDEFVPKTSRPALDEIVFTNDNVAVLGEPGDGKTVLMLELAKSYAKMYPQIGKIPVHIDLSRYHGQGLNQLLADGVEEIGIPEHSVRKMLKDGEFVFLLDGLDETDQWYGEFHRELRSIGGNLRQNRFVVSCRVNDYKPIGDFRELTISGVTNRQLREYLNEDEGTRGLHKILSNKPRFTLWQNRLLLNFLITLHQNNKIDLDFKNEAELYDKVINLFLEREEDTTDNYDLQRLENLKLLSGIAYAMQAEKKGSRLSKADVEAVILSNLPGDRVEFRNKVYDQVKRNGLIKFQKGLNGEGDNFKFVHRSLQEYLCARGILDRLQSGESDIYDTWENILSYQEDAEIWGEQIRIIKPAWRETAVYLGCIIGPYNMSAFMSILSSSIKKDWNWIREKGCDPAESNAELITDLINARGEISPDVFTWDFMRFILSRNGPPYFSSFVKARHGEMNTGEVVIGRYDLLGYHHSGIDLYAEVSEERMINALANYLHGEGNQLKSLALKRLNKLGTNSAVQAIIGFANASELDYSLCCAIKNLGEIGSDEAVDYLVGLTSTMETLSQTYPKVGSKWRVEPFLPRHDDLSGHGPMDIREILAQSLWGLGESESISGAWYLISYVQNQNCSDPQSAMMALAINKTPLAIGFLADYLRRPKNKHIRSAILALRSGQSYETTRALAEYVKVPGIPNRDLAVNVMQAISTSSAVEELIDYIEHEISTGSEYDVQQGIQALGRSRSEKAAEFLNGYISNTDGVCISDAFEAIGQLGFSSSVQPLIDYINDHDNENIEIALCALGTLNCNSQIKFLRLYAQDPRNKDRYSAMGALAKLDAEGALDMLIAHTDDDDYYGRGLYSAISMVQSRRSLKLLVDTDRSLCEGREWNFNFSEAISTMQKALQPTGY